MATMTAAEKLSYRHDKRNAQNQFQQLSAVAGLRKQQAADIYGRTARDIGVEYKKIRTSLPGIFNQRGFLRSGVFDESKRMLAAEKARKISDALAQQSYTQQAADLEISQARTNMVNALQMIDAREEARLADLAAVVEGVSF